MQLVKSNKKMTVFGYEIGPDTEVSKWGDDHVQVTLNYIRNNISGDNTAIIKPANYGVTPESFMEEIIRLNNQ